MGMVATSQLCPSMKDRVHVGRGCGGTLAQGPGGRQLHPGLGALSAHSVAGGWPLEGPHFVILDCWSCGCCFGCLVGDVSSAQSR